MELAALAGVSRSRQTHCCPAPHHSLSPESVLPLVAALALHFSVDPPASSYLAFLKAVSSGKPTRITPKWDKKKKSLLLSHRYKFIHSPGC